MVKKIMNYILTFVAADPDKNPLTLDVMPHGHTTWLSPKKAADISIEAPKTNAELQKMRAELASKKIDVFLTSAVERRKKLLLADMDSTIVSGETLDDLAEFAGLKDKIAAITAKAMNGELNFHDAIRERVGLLKDLPVSAINKTLELTRLNPGAQTFVKTMKKHGSTCVLVSGGFTFFTKAIAEQAGFDHNHGNELIIENEALTGKVKEPILDKHAKVAFLEQYMRKQGIKDKECLTIGDGANDLPMLQRAGLGIGYKAKPNVMKELTNTIIHGDLSAALFAQGYREEDFV